MVATSLPALAIWWLVMSVLVVVVVYDYYHLIIPDRVVVWLGVLAGVWLVWQFFAGASLSALVLDIGAAAFGAAIYGGLWFVSKGQWLGLGDAKLAWPLGVLLGAEHVFSLVVFSFWIGAIISVSLIAVQWLRRRGQPHLRFLQQPLTIKSEVPFAPFLVMSFLAIYFFGLDALAFTEQLVSLS
jgi:prepilin signal peptidase PulO-like enzyme (type II secretory pathway)